MPATDIPGHGFPVSDPHPQPPSDPRDALIEALREQATLLREIITHKDTIILHQQTIIQTKEQIIGLYQKE